MDAIHKLDVPVSIRLQRYNLFDIFEIFIRLERFYRAKLDFIAANDPYRADIVFTRTHRVERCSRSVTRSRRSESPCLLVRKRRKERMEIRHFRPIVSLRALALADGETSCYSISMQRAKKRADFRVTSDWHFIDYGNWSVARFDDEFREWHLDARANFVLVKVDSRSLYDRTCDPYSRGWVSSDPSDPS